MTTNAVSQEEQQLVVFDLATELYGVDIGVVREIIRMQDLTRPPQTSFFVEGVINLRGKVTPVIDLRKRLSLPTSEQDKDTRILVVDVEDQDIGVIVDEVVEVLRISSDSIEPASSVVTGADSPYLLGIVKLDDRLIILLDLPQALSEENMDLASYQAAVEPNNNKGSKVDEKVEEKAAEEIEEEDAAAETPKAKVESKPEPDAEPEGRSEPEPAGDPNTELLEQSFAE